MNSNRVIPVLAATVVALLIAAVALTFVLMKNPVPEPSPVRPPPAAPPTPRVAETVVEIEPAKPSEPAAANQSARPKPAVQPQTQPAPISENAPAEQAGIGRIGILVGQATATGADGGVRVLSPESRVFLNDRIETQKGGRIRIMLDDGTVIEQGEMSVLVLDQYVCCQSPPSDSAFAARIVKGLCRFITGLITKLNPDRFSVKTGMATIGIRGCDVAIRSGPAGDSIYVLDLGGNEKVRVALSADEGTESPFQTVIDKPGTALDLGSGVSSMRAAKAGTSDKPMAAPRPMTQEEVRSLLSEVSPYPPAKHDLMPGASESVLRLKAPASVPKQE